jgi:hypothetical protein
MRAEFPYRVDLWFDDECTRIEEPLAAASSIKLGRAAYNAAVLERPERMITLPNRTMVLAQSRRPPLSADNKVVPIRRIPPVFVDTK